jgi:lipoprotein-releasing system ATP-binding protein
MSSILEVRNLEKVYGRGVTKVRALQDISFSVERGRFALVVGSSGSGKSTLLNMIGLLDAPTRGNVIIDGTDATRLSEHRTSTFRNKKLGFVFQFSNLLADLTVLENVMLPCQIGGAGTDIRERAHLLLKSVGMEPFMHKRAGEISGGQAQRTAIARGLINNPAIVLADEPTGNLDSVSAESVVDLMKSIAAKTDTTFIVVTHDYKQFGKTDQVITLRDGRLAENAMLEVSAR